MRSVRLFMVGVLAFGLAACGSGASTGSSQAAKSNQKTMPDVTGKKLDVAETDIQKVGFDPEKIKFIGGGTFGPVIKSNWQVCAQDPAAGQPLSSNLQLTIERSCASGSTPASAPTSATSGPSSSGPTSSASAARPPATLTAKNNKDLAALLKVSDNCSSNAAATFASKYAGRNIEFDGSVQDVADAGDGTVNVLVGPGDKGSKTTTGPTFQLKGVDPSDVSNAAVDDKLHIVATVDEFNTDQCLLFLTPVSTRLR